MSGTDATRPVRLAGIHVPTDVVDGIRAASQHTGVDFRFMLAQAHRESRFQTDVRAPTTSATGLYQFTRHTWLAQMKHHGAEHGYGDLSAHIIRKGRDFVVNDPKIAARILDLRRDPYLSAVMAADLARDNRQYLQRELKRPIKDSELYLAHFLGPGGAAKILTAQAADPTQSAAAVLPKAARANAGIFFDKAGQPRSVAEVTGALGAAIERSMASLSGVEGPSSTPARPPGTGTAGVAIAALTAPAAPARGPVAPREDSRQPPAVVAMAGPGPSTPTAGDVTVQGAARAVAAGLAAGLATTAATATPSAPPTVLALASPSASAAGTAAYEMAARAGAPPLPPERPGSIGASLPPVAARIERAVVDIGDASQVAELLFQPVDARAWDALPLPASPARALAENRTDPVPQSPNTPRSTTTLEARTSLEARTAFDARTAAHALAITTAEAPARGEAPPGAQVAALSSPPGRVTAGPDRVEMMVDAVFRALFS